MNVRVRSATVCCFPGSTFCDIADKVPGVLFSLLKIDKIIHNQHAQILKPDLLSTEKIELHLHSGPIPA